MIHIGGCITENYINKSLLFLRSLESINNNFCVCYGFDPIKISSRFPKVNFFYLERKYAEINGMVQWGVWLNAIDSNDQDIYIISDADIIIQRSLNLEEINRFSSYDDNTIGAGINEDERDCLSREAWRMKLKPGYVYNPDAMVVNCGVLVGKRAVFRKITEEMDKRIPEFNKFSDHRCRCQFLICSVMNSLGIRIDLLDRDFHCNGHFNGHLWMPEHCNKVYLPDFPHTHVFYKDKLVMFKHAFNPKIF